MPQSRLTWAEDCVRLKNAIGQDLVPVDVLSQLRAAIASGLSTQGVA